MANNPFKYSQGERIKIVGKQKKEIKNLYLEALNEIRKDINRTFNKDTENNQLKRVQLNRIKDELINYIDDVDRRTEKIVRNNMDLMVTKVIENNNIYMHNMGFKNLVTNPEFKQDVVNRIVTGKLYDNRWNLSSAIWNDNALKRNEINLIVSKGILKNKSVYEIAKSLEKYVNPNVKKDYIIPGTRRVVDYNAQRLAQTMISHSYQESFVAMTKNNPFIEAYQWITSGSDRVCPLCIDRETSDEYGLGPGIFPKDSLPMDHPNGMCTFDIVTSMTEIEIADAIADWYLDEGDEEMNHLIDDYVNFIK